MSQSPRAIAEPSFNPHEKLLQMKKGEWEELTEEVFQEVFKRSAVKRTKYAGLKRNILFLREQITDRTDLRIANRTKDTDGQ